MDFDDYKNTMPYPFKPKKPHLNVTHSSSDAMEYSLALKNYELELFEFNKEMDVYHEMDAKLYNQFMQDTWEDLGIANNPKRNRLFSIAWEMGHSSGYSEVYHYASEMVDLIKD